ncbi:hypothetical protein ACFLTP_06435 [Chloroflexota bacterium]
MKKLVKNVSHTASHILYRIFIPDEEWANKEAKRYQEFRYC